MKHLTHYILLFHTAPEGLFARVLGMRSISEEKNFLRNWEDYYGFYDENNTEHSFLGPRKPVAAFAQRLRLSATVVLIFFQFVLEDLFDK